jgi:hypothetical protein
MSTTFCSDASLFVISAAGHHSLLPLLATTMSPAGPQDEQLKAAFAALLEEEIAIGGSDGIQARLARNLGVSQQYVSMLVACTRVMGKKAIAGLMRHYKKPLSWVYGGAPPPSGTETTDAGRVLPRQTSGKSSPHRKGGDRNVSSGLETRLLAENQQLKAQLEASEQHVTRLLLVIEEARATLDPHRQELVDLVPRPPRARKRH